MLTGHDMAEILLKRIFHLLNTNVQNGSGEQYRASMALLFIFIYVEL